MSRLRRQDTPGPALRRIACEQVETAIRCLTRQAGQGLAASVAIQQTKSVLALIEPDLPRQNVRLARAILVRLSAGLEAMAQEALLLEQLNAQYKKSPADKELAAAVKSLRKRWSASDQSEAAMSSKAGSFNPGIYRLVADMAELRGHLDAWPIDAVASDSPPRGLRRTYAKARRLAKEPVAIDTAKSLVAVLQELADQFTILNKACPVMVKAQRKLITRAADVLAQEILSDRLNQALRQEIGKAATKVLPKPEPLADRVAEVVEGDLAAALAESPAALMKRMQGYWSAWGGDSPS